MVVDFFSTERVKAGTGRSLCLWDDVKRYGLLSFGILDFAKAWRIKKAFRFKGGQ